MNESLWQRRTDLKNAAALGDFDRYPAGEIIFLLEIGVPNILKFNH